MSTRVVQLANLIAANHHRSHGEAVPPQPGDKLLAIRLTDPQEWEFTATGHWCIGIYSEAIDLYAEWTVKELDLQREINSQMSSHAYSRAASTTAPSSGFTVTTHTPQRPVVPDTSPGLGIKVAELRDIQSKNAALAILITRLENYGDNPSERLLSALQNEAVLFRGLAITNGFIDKEIEDMVSEILRFHGPEAESDPETSPEESQCDVPTDRRTYSRFCDSEAKVARESDESSDPGEADFAKHYPQHAGLLRLTSADVADAMRSECESEEEQPEQPAPVEGNEDSTSDYSTDSAVNVAAYAKHRRRLGNKRARRPDKSMASQGSEGYEDYLAQPSLASKFRRT